MKSKLLNIVPRVSSWIKSTANGLDNLLYAQHFNTRGRSLFQKQPNESTVASVNTLMAEVSEQTTNFLKNPKNIRPHSTFYYDWSANQQYRCGSLGDIRFGKQNKRTYKCELHLCTLANEKNWQGICDTISVTKGRKRIGASIGQCLFSKRNETHNGVNLGPLFV